MVWSRTRRSPVGLDIRKLGESSECGGWEVDKDQTMQGLLSKKRIYEV